MTRSDARLRPDLGLCLDCARAHDHCHDALVIHGRDAVECSGGQGCDAREDRHELLVWCRDLQPACTC